MRWIAVASALSLAACAATMEPGPAGGGPTTADNGNDCAVIVAVAKEHFRLGPESAPMQVSFEDGFDPGCDWARYGLNLTPRRAETSTNPREIKPFVSFDRPRYDGQGAVIAVGIIHGPLAGQGSECRVRSGFAGWTVAEGDCKSTWVS
ncbi:MAG: hypothetical protein EON89_14160 [Brevundimonas sp.]|nr:MAG: hypothetical protein EON89_14160 [Brevundimonas sp.]